MSSQEVVDFINERIQKGTDLKIICEEVNPNSCGIIIGSSILC